VGEGLSLAGKTGARWGRDGRARSGAGARVSCGVLEVAGVSPAPGEDVRTVCSEVPSPLARVCVGRAGLEDGAPRRVEKGRMDGSGMSRSRGNGWGSSGCLLEKVFFFFFFLRGGGRGESEKPEV
jgi:hypothetical protein